MEPLKQVVAVVDLVFGLVRSPIFLTQLLLLLLREVVTEMRLLPVIMLVDSQIPIILLYLLMRDMEVEVDREERQDNLDMLYLFMVLLVTQRRHLKHLLIRVVNNHLLFHK